MIEKSRSLDAYVCACVRVCVHAHMCVHRCVQLDKEHRYQSQNLWVHIGLDYRRFYLECSVNRKLQLVFSDPILWGKLGHRFAFPEK